MATIKQVYAASAVVGFVTNAINSAATDVPKLSDEVDNSTNKYLAIDLELNFNWLTGTPDGTVDVYLAASADGTTYADDAETANLLFLASVTPDSATNTNTVTKIIRVEQVPKKWKLLVINTDTLALGATNNTVNYVGVDLSNA